MSVRNSSAVGRFHGAVTSNGHAMDKEMVTKETRQEGCYRRWLRKVSPCCRRRASTSYDVANEMDTMVKEEETVAPCPEPPEPHTEVQELDESSLVVRSVDLLSSKSSQNRKEHHTERYHGDELIIRRGQTFHIMLDLSRPFNINTDKLYLELKTGPQPLVSKGTHIIIPLVEELKDLCWEAKVVEQNANSIKLSINSASNAVIGRYKLTVSTQRTGSEAVNTHDPEKDVYMLFNPWCEGDTVYMDDDAEKKEYVLNDTGKIYYGTEKQIGARTWNFGQFQEGILDACLYVLEKSEISPSGRGDPVIVVRVISAMINSPDDCGVLEGNWSGNYLGGTPPTAWSGSVDILKKYHKEEGTPVKYGQCWVFSGVTTTVLRCLGIPCRSVTNFQSAHDTDVSLTTDVYLDENLEPINSLNYDSVWNFHVWNDCWMARPDLPPGMGGWQAVDSTPQETSQGTFRCGPASITAIRTGQVYLKHDAPFVFAEVNSDKIYWQREVDGTFSKIHIEKNVVGRCISTKAVGSDQRSDITHLYKHPEGSEEERIAVETACRYGTKPNVYASAGTDDVSMEVRVEGEGPRMGGDANLKIVLKNQSENPRKTTLHSQVAVMYYTGVLKDTVKSEKISVDLMPKEEKVVDWVLPYQDYQNQLVDQAALMLTLSGRVNETMQVLASQTSFRLRTPDILIEPLGETYVGKEATAKLTFSNPLPCTLRNVVLRVEGLGLRNLHPIIVG
ncbi:protein-glutamine gamma-glutamyltransferase K-like, partial [Clarias magur]